ncbi:1,2-phenylacetyl-CoA epoxidase subunit B [Cryomorpha ignava]|uniref:1,2-phenylacetyl-CoA epoxidase subunit B n=1 Tax=Cryomorpha ignava TaxID=101383 RepID=A0A7K3WUV5_9FLAO|nr:1,2-phenylacetyl-CoA epoxidase subunit PaaB [Cryomorpha ignava]NEN24831.1 1,2-phenylacetyl-CoA epoxidase subunit B [Cryomorpha ignava]
MTDQKNDNSEQGILWEVFVQAKPGLAHKHSGSLHATDAEMALKSARDVYTRRSEGVSIWVVPATEITATTEGDSDSFFDPADDKVYRHPTFYTVPEGVKYL